jgi:tetratricopeptide (TPR) repeat protein
VAVERFSLLFSNTRLPQEQVAFVVCQQQHVSKLKRRRHAENTAYRWRGASGILFLGLLQLSAVGCVAFGRRSPVPEEIATCRELSRQGVAAFEMGRWVESEVLLRKAIEASPNDSETRRYLAEALWHRGAADEALREIEAALSMDRYDASLNVRAGEMWLAVGDTKQAIAHAEQAIGIDPKLASAWALRGRVFWQMNETDRAMADLQRALQYAPNNSDVLLDLAALYRQRGQPTRCLTTLHHLLETYPPGEEPQLVLLLEGLTLSELGRPQQAVESLLAASQRGPRNVEVLYRLAQAQLAAGDPATAAITAEQALAVDATHEQSRKLVAELSQPVAPNGTMRR